MDVSTKDVKDLSKLVTKKLHHYVNYYRRAERFDSSGKGYYRTTPQMLPYDRQYRLYEIVELEKQEKKRKSHNSDTSKGGNINLKLIKNSRSVVLKSEVARLQSTANTVLKSTPVRDLQAIHRYRPYNSNLSDETGYLPIIPCHVGSILRSQSCMDYYSKENARWAKKRTIIGTRAQQESKQVASHDAILTRKKLHKLKFLNDRDNVRSTSPVTTSEATVEDMWTINIEEYKRDRPDPSTRSDGKQQVTNTGDIDASSKNNETKTPPKTFLTSGDFDDETDSSDDGYISPATGRQESSTHVQLHSGPHSPSADGSGSDDGSTFSSASNEKKVETFVSSIIDAAGTDVFSEICGRKDTALEVHVDESTFSNASHEKSAALQMETFVSSIIEAAWSDVFSEFYGRKETVQEVNVDNKEQNIGRSNTPLEREIQTTVASSLTGSLTSLSSSSSDDSSSTDSSSASILGGNHQTAASTELDGNDVQHVDGEAEAERSLPGFTSLRRMSDTSLSSTSSDDSDSSGSFQSYYAASTEQLENKADNQNVNIEQLDGNATNSDNTSADLEDLSKELTTVHVEDRDTLEQENNEEKMTKSDLDEEGRSSPAPDPVASPSPNGLEAYSTVYHMSKMLSH